MHEETKAKLTTARRQATDVLRTLEVARSNFTDTMLQQQLEIETLKKQLYDKETLPCPTCQQNLLHARRAEAQPRCDQK
jgi:hypothetical protein